MKFLGSISGTVKRGRRRSRNVLMVLAALLVTSGLIRLGSGAGLAVALEKQPTEVKAQSMVPDADQGDIEPILEALRAKEERLAKAEADLKEREDAFAARTQKREADLSQVESRIQEKLVELEAAEAALSATISQAETAAEDDLNKLTAVYENMKPKNAALLFEEMDPEFSAGFLARMRPEAAAAVLAGMSPERAYSVSAILAGRNAKAAKQ